MEGHSFGLKLSVELSTRSSVAGTEDDKPEISVSLFTFTERGDFPYLLLSILAMLATAGCSAGQSIVYGLAFDKLGELASKRISPPHFIDQIGLICGMLVVIGAAKAALVWFGTLMSMLFAERQAKRARVSITRRILTRGLQPGDGTGNTAGDLNQIHRCVEEFREGISEAVGQLMLSGCSIVALFITGLASSWLMTLVMSATFPVIFAIGFVFWRLMFRAVEAENHWSALASNVVHWCGAHSSTVRIFNGQEVEVSKFQKYTNHSAREFIRLMNLSAGNDGIIRAIGLSMCVEGFWYGLTLIHQHSASVQSVFTAFSACMMIGPEMSELSDHVCTINEAKAAVRLIRRAEMETRVEKDEEQVSEKHTKEGQKLNFGLYPSSDNTLMRLKGVSYVSNNGFSIESTSLDIAGGKFTFLVGPSGCGKSTIADFLMGFRTPSSGIVTVGGSSVELVSRRWLNDKMTLIQQDSVIFEESLWENVACAGHEKSRLAPEQESIGFPACLVDTALKFAGLEDLRLSLGNTKISPGSLSGGQKQRVGLARARLRNTPILVLDESFSSLDFDARVEMMARVRRWRRGKTTLIITHNLGEIGADDQVVLMEKGKVVAAGALSQVEQRPEYRAFKGESVADKSPKGYTTEHKPVTSVDEVSAEGSENHIPVLSAVQVLRNCAHCLPSYWILAAGLACSVVNGVMTPVFSFCSSHLVNMMVSPHSEHKQMVLWSCCALVVAAITGVFTYLTQFTMAYASERWVLRIRQTVFNKLSAQEIDFFSTRSPAYLASLLINDTRDLRVLVSDLLAIYTSLVVMVLVGVIWALVVGWKMALVGLSFGPLLIAITQGYARSMEGAEDRYKTRVTHAEQLALECMANLRTIVCFDLTGRFQKRADSRLQHLQRAGTRRALLVGLGLAMTDLCSSASTATILYYGMKLVGQREYSTQQFVQIVTMLTFVTTTGATLLHQIPEITRAQRVGSHISRLLVLEEAHLETGGARYPSYFPVKLLIEAKNLRFSYGPLPVFSNLSFSINKGEVVGIVGQSGRGKSTMFKLLLKLHEVSSGCLSVAGTDINAISTHWLRTKIAVIPQDPQLFEGTIRENLTYGLGTVTNDEISLVLQQVNMFDYVDSLPKGLDTPVQVYPACSLSGGQAQRLCIARTLLRKPAILLLDECTSRLDPANKRIIMAIITSRHKMTILVIAHDEEIMLVVDRKIAV